MQREPITRGNTGFVTEKVVVLFKSGDEWRQCEYARKADPREIRGYEKLQPILPDHILAPHYSDPISGVVWIPWVPRSRNFDEILAEAQMPEEDMYLIWDEFVLTMIDMWLRTKHSRQPNYQSEFLERLDGRTKEARVKIKSVKFDSGPMRFEELLERPLRVNGRQFARLSILIQSAKKAVVAHPCPKVVTAQRDEHAANLVVIPTKFDSTFPWYLVDLPNVSEEADWTYSIGKMLHWFKGYYVVNVYKRLPPKRMRDLAMESREANGGEIVINYDLGTHMRLICRRSDEITMRHATSFAALIGDEEWEQRLPAMLFGAFYSGMANHLEYPPRAPAPDWTCCRGHGASAGACENTDRRSRA